MSGGHYAEVKGAMGRFAGAKIGKECRRLYYEVTTEDQLKVLGVEIVAELFVE